MNLSDEKLMELYRSSKDAAVFSVLYQRHFGSLCKFLTWQLKDAEQAKDLAQNILLRVYQRPQLFDPNRNFKVWLFSVAKNSWKNHLRARNTRQQHTNSAATQWINSDTEGTSPNGQEKSNLVKTAVQQLSEAHREVILLKYSNNLSIPEISRILECSTGTVKSRLFYALKQLRKLTNEKLKI